MSYKFFSSSPQYLREINKLTIEFQPEVPRLACVTSLDFFRLSSIALLLSVFVGTLINYQIISLFAQVDLKLKDENADLGTYVLNGEWHLLGKPRQSRYWYLLSKTQKSLNFYHFRKPQKS